MHIHTLIAKTTNNKQQKNKLSTRRMEFNLTDGYLADIIID